MKALVVYDSVFGNTEQVAQAMGEALQADVRRAGEVEAADLVGLDVLLVGSPTRAFQPTAATKQFLKRIPRNSLGGVRVAGFDTRADLEEVGSRVLTFFVGLFGYAAEPIARRLVRKGGLQVVSPAGFIVGGTEGPLREGELARAREWALRVVNEDAA